MVKVVKRKVGFNKNLYLRLQSKAIKEKMKLFPDKLYLEFGGKLLDDYHAARVLPGFEINAKIGLIKTLKKDAEVIICIKASDIEKNKIRNDYGITYDQEVLRLMEELKHEDIDINSVVITLYNAQPSAEKFKLKLESMGVKTYFHRYTKGYPTNVDVVVSEEGYGQNPYIETTKKLIIVTAPGAGSGKLATCLSQLYHEYKMGLKSGYAKNETFPIWDLPLKHPINMAYEASTADINDRNMIDSFHLDAYGIQSVNYNRDLEVFPILKNILYKITGANIYSSPTDMGVNTINQCITNPKLIEEASKEEIIRRYFKARADFKLGLDDEEPSKRIKILMNELEIEEENREVVIPARNKAIEKGAPVVSLELPNHKIITGKQTDIFTPTVSLILNALKEITSIPDDVDLLSSNVLQPILDFKPKIFHSQTHLNLQEVFIALSICSVTNPMLESALKNLEILQQCEAHATYIIPNEEMIVLKNLKINITCDPEFMMVK